MSLAAEPRAPYLSQQGPWRPRDLGRVLVFAGLGALGLVVGWYGASGHVRLADQAIWVVVSTGAAAVGGVSMTTWLISGMRAVRSEHRALHEQLFADLVQEHADVTDVTAPTVIAEGMRFYHRSSCLFVAGKPVVATDGVGHAACSWCRP